VLPEFQAYCRLIAGLPDRYPVIRSSTLTAYTIGPLTAEIVGEVTFADDYVLRVWELLDLSKQAIFSYSYELDQAGERVSVDPILAFAARSPAVETAGYGCQAH
jgi:hypothetical protein